MDDIKVITYHSTNAPIDERWIGYVILPNGKPWQVRFSGTYEESVIANAKEVYLAEMGKQTRLRNNLDCGVRYPQIKDDTGKLCVSTGRGHHLTGKVWVINRTTHDLKRIEPAELASYEANGYVRGGPRSK